MSLHLCLYSLLFLNLENENRNVTCISFFLIFTFEICNLFVLLSYIYMKYKHYTCKSESR